MNEKYETFLLLASDTVKEQAKDQATKMFADLFKSSILMKYKDAFEEALAKGMVQKSIEKSMKFCYTDICVTIRQCSTMQDDEKDGLIRKGNEMILSIKGIVTQILLNKVVKIFS